MNKNEKICLVDLENIGAMVCHLSYFKHSKFHIICQKGIYMIDINDPELQIVYKVRVEMNEKICVGRVTEDGKYMILAIRTDNGSYQLVSYLIADNRKYLKIGRIKTEMETE